MRIQLASDLHLERLRTTFPGDPVITPAPSADVLVLAGDVANGLEVVDYFARWPVPVLYVAGNHEFFGQEMSELRTALRLACTGTAIRFLDNDCMEFGGVRFLGATLWTDYRLGRERNQGQLMEYAGEHLGDHFTIETDGGVRFSPKHALREHQHSRAWLERQLTVPYEGKTVVVTHHAPHPLSVHARYTGDLLSAAFVSNLEGLVEKADVWLHGHVHDSFDYRLGRCRVVANPLGYADESDCATSISELAFENAGFERTFVIEV